MSQGPIGDYGRRSYDSGSDNSWERSQVADRRRAEEDAHRAAQQWENYSAWWSSLSEEKKRHLNKAADDRSRWVWSIPGGIVFAFLVADYTVRSSGSAGEFERALGIVLTVCVWVFAWRAVGLIVRTIVLTLWNGACGGLCGLLCGATLSMIGKVDMPNMASRIAIVAGVLWGLGIGLSQALRYRGARPGRRPWV